MLSDIEIFVHVVESGSFTEAAERLELSKSVVSKYVTRLETRLNARLLNRTTRRLSLTEVGRVFYERSLRGLQEIDDATAEVSRLTREPRGTLRLNTPMSFGIQHVAPLLPEFHRRYPEVSVDMNLDDRKLEVIEPGFDVSIRVADLPDSSLVARRLAPCRHVVVASPDYIKEHGAPKTPAELSNHTTVLYRHQASASDWYFRGAGNKNVSVTVLGTVQINNSLAIREAILGGLGIARMPLFVVGDDIEEGRLCQLLPGYKTLELSIYVVYPQRQFLPPKARVFVDFLVEKFSAVSF